MTKWSQVIQAFLSESMLVFGKTDPLSPLLSCSISFCQPEISTCGSDQYVYKLILSGHSG